MHWSWIWFDSHISIAWEWNMCVYRHAHFMYRSGVHARPLSRNEKLTRSNIGGRERFFGDWWFKRWETINVWWGRQDPAPWTAIKCRHENRTQPVLIRVHEDLFFPFPLQRYAGPALSSPLFLFLCPCNHRDHEVRPDLVACRSDRFRRRREEGGRTSKNV